MAKKKAAPYEVTVGRKSFTLDKLQADALTLGVWRYEAGDAALIAGNGRRVPYLGGQLSPTRMMYLIEQKLVADSFQHPRILSMGKQVAHALWPLLHDGEELEAKRSAHYAEIEAGRRENEATAARIIKGFTGIKDGEGKSIATRLRKQRDRSRRWEKEVGSYRRRGLPVHLNLSDDDLVAVAEQITELRERSHANPGRGT